MVESSLQIRFLFQVCSFPRNAGFLETQFSRPRKERKKVHEVHSLQVDTGPKVVFSYRIISRSGSCVPQVSLTRTSTEIRTKRIHNQSWATLAVKLKTEKKYFEDKTDGLLNAGDGRKAGKPWYFCEHSQKVSGTALALRLAVISSFHPISPPNVVYLFPWRRHVSSAFFKVTGHDWDHRVLIPRCSECEVALDKCVQREWVWKDFFFFPPELIKQKLEDWRKEMF